MRTDLDVYFEGTTKVLEYIRITVVFTSGEKLDILDDARKTKIKRRLWWTVIDGRFNYALINRFKVAVISIDIQAPREEKNIEGYYSEDAGRGDGQQGRRGQHNKVD